MPNYMRWMGLAPLWLLVDDGGVGLKAVCLYTRESADQMADGLTDHGDRAYGRLAGQIVERVDKAWSPVTDGALAAIIARHLDKLHEQAKAEIETVEEDHD